MPGWFKSHTQRLYEQGYRGGEHIVDSHCDLNAAIEAYEQLSTDETPVNDRRIVIQGMRDGYNNSHDANQLKWG